MRDNRITQRGFAMVTAVFILVVLAALGAFILTVSSTQQAGSALDIQGARAYQAARAGIEWGVFQVTRNAGYADPGNVDPTRVLHNPSPAVLPAGFWCASLNPAAPTTASFSMPAGATALAGFAVTVQCYATRGASNDANAGPWIFVIEATACSPAAAGPACPGDAGGLGYVERRLRVTL